MNTRLQDTQASTWVGARPRPSCAHLAAVGVVLGQNLWRGRVPRLWVHADAWQGGRGSRSAVRLVLRPYARSTQSASAHPASPTFVKAREEAEALHPVFQRHLCVGRQVLGLCIVVTLLQRRKGRRRRCPGAGHHLGGGWVLVCRERNKGVTKGGTGMSGGRALARGHRDGILVSPLRPHALPTAAPLPLNLPPLHPPAGR